jgi:uncharacterized protein (DUF4415 family)
MKKEAIVRTTLEDARRTPSKMDWDRIDATTDEEIERQSREDNEDLGLIETDWSNAVFVPAPQKNAISIRLDADVLSFFRSQGPGYQSRINQVLRHYMESVEKKAG